MRKPRAVSGATVLEQDVVKPLEIGVLQYAHDTLVNVNTSKEQRPQVVFVDEIACGYPDDLDASLSGSRRVCEIEALLFRPLPKVFVIADDGWRLVFAGLSPPVGLFSGRHVELSFPGQWENLKDKEFDVIKYEILFPYLIQKPPLTCNSTPQKSLWRPLHGPNFDWPLTLLDFASVEPDDMILNDDLHRDRAMENTLLHFNEKHRWYFVNGQTVDDVLVFRIVDSTGKRASKFIFFNSFSHFPLHETNCQSCVCG
ncbi:uncharacterized protein PODANS_4_2305 [Podospora anserina S mat+]|uniref:Podospora anserina S mat+ genomic DNA chromosome 4, supercontig 2 n=1 Tax=Podospora anserina (strain S / ATCC MYA-4624 / DSM 980 / FGSC 10383) TaxID=515849 RepID=B2ADZ2_PODAN|nr:uncharacterized protein PODANS_4_2305 [Podospora anserina S mat+]CAP61657.1 unnamed protein product [Podospora anserina S mat+]CDP28008.1 Putative protein of unknown function [Podospora anserina S mat+]